MGAVDSPSPCKSIAMPSDGQWTMKHLGRQNDT